ncbi:hypothetical protein [Neptuniibacter marinus]|uniref:hypothetical protein n=1 Tax=Neptuniibacter marinus TaxID=1806670 RepID=UPI003B5BA3EE
MKPENYICSEQFEPDWKHSKKEIQSIIKPLLKEADDRLRFSATLHKKSQIAWIEIREPHPDIRLLAITLPRDVQPLSLRITAWFYEHANESYSRWCDTALPSGLLLKQVSTNRKPSGSWKNSPALKDNDITLVGVEHVCRELPFSDETSLTAFLVPLLKQYVQQLLQVLNGSGKTYRLLGSDGELFKSPVKGVLGGNSKEKRYGELHCSAANNALSRGYAGHRVFFANEEDAIAAGYKPCGTCMKEQYRKWNEGGEPGSSDYPWVILPKP